MDKFCITHIRGQRALSRPASFLLLTALLLCGAAVGTASAHAQAFGAECAKFFARDPAAPVDETSVVDRSGYLLAEKFRLNLLLMRDHPELIGRYSDPLAERMLATEIRLRKETDALVQYPPLEPPFNTAHPAFVYEWSELQKTQPAVASGAALDVYLRQEADWPFLKRDAAWNEKLPQAWAGMFLFPRSSEVDRDPKFAVREVSPILEQQLRLASKRQAADLWIPLTLAPKDFEYDAAGKTILFKTDLLAASRSGVPADLRTLQAYEMPDQLGGEGAQEAQQIPGKFRFTLDELRMWRSMVGFMAGADQLDLDRQLRLQTVKVDGKVAEADGFGRPNDRLNLRLYLTVQRTEAETGSETKFAMISTVKKIEIVDYRGNVLATITAASLPKPGTTPLLSPVSIAPGLGYGNEITKGENCRSMATDRAQTQRKVAAESGARAVARKSREELNRACNEQAAHEADKAGPSPGPAWQAALKVARESCLAAGPTAVAAGSTPAAPAPRPAVTPPPRLPQRQPVQVGPATTARLGEPANSLTTSSRGMTVDRVTASLPFKNGRYAALVIGVDHYQAPLHDLKTAVHDAQAISDVLRDKYGFEVTTLLNEQATRDNILDAITHLQDTLGDNDNLLIYYAGHGYSLRGPDGKTYEKAYWLPADANSASSSHRIIADDLTTDIKQIRARHILVISDSCYAGGLSRDADSIPTAVQPSVVTRMLANRSRTLMASGGDEPVSDGGPDGHSVFAAALLKALGSATTPMFTANQLFMDGVEPLVVGNSEQTPLYDILRNSGHENGDFVFTMQKK